jgi:hypothetical protein
MAFTVREYVARKIDQDAVHMEMDGLPRIAEATRARAQRIRDGLMESTPGLDVCADFDVLGASPAEDDFGYECIQMQCVEGTVRWYRQLWENGRLDVVEVTDV